MSSAWRPSHRPQRGGILLNLILLLFVAMLCVAVYLARYPLMRFAAESWMVEDAIDRADAIIVLSDDNFYADRATRAAELFREDKGPLVVASGRRLRPSAGIAELMEHDLIERGVPKEKIVRFPHDADNTLEEAQALARLVTSSKWRSVIVVTSNYHARRARYIFRRVFPQNVEVRVASAPDGEFDSQLWWKKRGSIKKFTHEIVGMMVAMWELRKKEPGNSATQGVVDVTPVDRQL